MPDYRTAGALLLLTALATAISVAARLSAGADDTPFTDALAQSRNLDADAIARLAASEKLRAIGSANIAYATGGAARLIAGLALWAASGRIGRTLSPFHPRAVSVASFLLAASGAVTAVSGGCAIALSVLAPEPQSSAVLVSEADLIGGAEESLLAIRQATGALGFTLAGLALVAFAPVQWRMGRILRTSAVVGAVLGVAMLFIWLDAATVVHRITGIGFLVSLILAGLWLITGRVRPPAVPLSR